jgi:hypothetical protein
VTDLVLGPLLRHVDETSATIWVETADPGVVTVSVPGASDSAHTFAVHGRHYALVCLDGLEKGSKYPYTVDCNGERVWPLHDTVYPDSVIPTLDLEKPLRLVFGSCRTSISHDAAGNRSHGVDALRAYALRMARITDGAHPDDPDPGDDVRWPDLVLFLGDQVYADETTPEMWTFINSRRDIDQPPGTELRDFEEYAHLYRLAWNDPANRWLLSTVPTAMIFDDHDIRDDWNTSQAWKEAMGATPWWHDRIVGGLASYWVYQHLGNLTPSERARDEVWAAIAAHQGEDELDVSDVLDELAERVDRHPDAYRWSYTWDFGSQARLVVVDSRAARVLDPEHRALLDDHELAWLDDQLCGDVDHLLVGTSLPFLLAPGLHYIEAFSEAVAQGAWGDRYSPAGEKLRSKVDLEHWAAFQSSFAEVSEMVLEVARGERGRAPATVTFLSGDVHHSYVAEARPSSRSVRGRTATTSRILQAVCSPIRNPLPPRWRFVTALSAYGLARPLGHLVARAAKVPRAPLRWELVRGPWFDNNLATLEIVDGALRMWWAKGHVDGGAHDRPRLVPVAEVTIERKQ